jgi:GT2 family glycosyltransferase
LDVSVIIISYNTKQLVLDCLASLAETVPPRSHEVIVVDNASFDDTVQAVRAQFPDTKVIENHENLGFARANNIGAAQASGEFLFLLNSDTLVYPGAVDTLICALEVDSKIGIASPMLVGTDGSAQETAGFLMTPSTVLFPWAKKRAKTAVVYALKHKEPLNDIAYFCGAAIMVRRSAFESIEGFDESFFFYCEDPDLCKRLVDAGWTMAFIPDAKIVHLGGSSAKKIRIRADIERHRSRCRYIWKHFGLSAAVAVGSMLFITAILQTLLNTFGSILTLGFGKSFIRRMKLNSAICLWFAIGMQGRESWMYRRFFGNWQK